MSLSLCFQFLVGRGRSLLDFLPQESPCLQERLLEWCGGGEPVSSHHNVPCAWGQWYGSVQG